LGSERLGGNLCNLFDLAVEEGVDDLVLVGEVSVKPSLSWWR
jgi:hypothetical protein